MKCTTCDTKMEFVADGVSSLFWCPNCGTLHEQVYNPQLKQVKEIWTVPNVSKAKGHRGR